MGEVVDLQSIGAELRVYGEISDPGMRYFNPSIAWHNGDLKIAIRSCNFAVERQGRWYFRDGNAYSKTDVIYGDVNPDTLYVDNLHKLELSKDSPNTILTAGLEDVRLFARSDGMHAIGFESDRLSRSLHNASASMAEYIIKENDLKYIRTLEKPVRDAVEKNWSPTDIPSKEFDFTYSPTQVYKDGEVLGSKYVGIIHGGTQLIKQNDGTFISIVHDKVINPLLNRPGIYDKYVYRHYLAIHNNNGIVSAVSKAFNFGTNENIEFAAGLVQYADDLIISIGIRDCKYALVKIPKEKLLTLLSN